MNSNMLFNLYIAFLVLFFGIDVGVLYVANHHHDDVIKLLEQACNVRGGQLIERQEDVKCVKLEIIK